MNKKAVLFSVIGLIVLISGIGAGLFLVKQQQELRSKAAPATTLSLSPSTTSIQVGQQFSVDIDVNTGENQIVIAEMYLTFNPQVLEATSVVAGSFFTISDHIPAQINNTAGTISYTIYLPPGSSPQQGTGTLASITFSALAQGTSVIDFSTNTIVGAVREGGQNVLIATNPTIINVSSTSEPTPTPAPTTSPENTPTPTPTVEPGIGGPETTPTPTPTPTVDPGVGGSADATPTPTPTPTTSTSTSSAQPVTGVNTPTILLISLGFLLLLSGTILFAL